MSNQDRFGRAPAMHDQGIVARPAHRIPAIERSLRPDDRGCWARIFGLIHKLGADDDDGPVSPIRY
jgi:hypothetical protein